MPVLKAKISEERKLYMKKKLLLGLALSVLSLGALAGCTNDDQGGEKPGPGPETPVVEDYFIQDPTTIYFWSTIGDNNQAQVNRYIESFKDVEPNVTVVNVKQNGSYNDLENMVITGFTANNYPDIVQAYPDHVADYIDYGKAVKLDEYMDNPDYGWTAEEKADVVQAYLTEGQEYTIEGTYSLPFSKSTEAMFYNEDILHGLDLSDIDPTINGGNPLNASYLNSLTWEEFFGKLAPALTTYNETVEQIITPSDGVSAIMGYDSDDNLFITLCEQYGYPYSSVVNGKGSVDFNTQEMQDLLTEWHGYVEKGYFITKGINEGNYVNELFNDGACLFSIGSTGGVKYQFSETNPSNVGVAMIPQAENGTPATINQGPSVAILDHNDENRRLASWLFYKHMTNEENSLDWALNSGYCAIRQSNYSDPAYLEANDVDATQPKSLERLMAKANNYIGTMTSTLFVSPAFKGSSTIRTQVGGLLTQCLLPTTDVSTIPALFDEAEAQSKLAL